MKVKIELRYTCKNNKWDNDLHKEIGENVIYMGDKCFKFIDTMATKRLFNDIIVQFNDVFMQMCEDNSPSDRFGFTYKGDCHGPSINESK
jgi:hypothetical protein